MYEDEYLDTEFQSLAVSAGTTIVAEHHFKRRVSSPKFLLGTGQVESLVETVKAMDIDVVLVNHALSAAQERNLEIECGCKVVDRSGLILDIFAQRAQSHDGKLQVELAQLRHLSTRLVRGWSHLERQKGGIGLRGPGETQLETDRRLLSGRIQHIKKRLARVRSQRHQSRRARLRANIPTVALVGYTNAGKSTLFNALCHAGVDAKDRLFDTLDPSFRKIDVPPLGEVVLIDTVGFVQDLPHELVVAFQATLEETKEADLLLHVVDSYHERRRQNISQVNQVLKEINADTVLKLMVYNKIDLNNREPYTKNDEEHNPYQVGVSAMQPAGMEELKSAISHLLAGTLVEASWLLGPHQGELRAKLHNLGAVLDESVDDQGQICLSIRLAKADYHRLWQEWQAGRTP